jgi:hypothetical protein
MNRYNSTERIGVFSTAQIFTEDFGWIFREQPIVDVGIDALIEVSENGEPLGKFIGLQIKSGKSNFKYSEDKLVYYISNIHYNYWLNLSIPMLLIAYFPDTKKTYWSEISKRKIKKTKTKWKIEIPIKNELCLKSKRNIAGLQTDKNSQFAIVKIFKGEEVNEENIYEVIEKLSCIADAKDAIVNMIKMLDDLKQKTGEHTEKINYYNSINQSFDSAPVIALIKSYAKDITLFSLRVEQECQIFSESFAEGLFAYEEIILLKYSMTSSIDDLKNEIQNLEVLPDALDGAVSGLTFLRNSISKLPEKYKVLNEAKEKTLSVLDMVISECQVGSTIVSNLLNSLDSISS